MSITVAKDNGVTVITVTSDRKSMLPPLCQILKNLCYSPMCCSVKRGLIQPDVVSALGTIQIMVGLFNIGLGPGRISLHPEDFAHLGVAYWLGGVCMLAGIMTLFGSQFPFLLLVGSTVLVNIVGAIISVLGIVMCIRDMQDGAVARMCNMFAVANDDDDCRFVAYYTQRLLTAMDIATIVFAVLQLCVCISVAVLGIRALTNRKEEEGCSDFESYQPVEVLKTSPGV